MNVSSDALIDLVHRSLTEHPEEWSRDDYRAEHPSGVSVWIANHHYGLDISANGRRVVGGVTVWSSFFGPFIPWRARLRKAAMAIPNRTDEPKRRALETLATSLLPTN